MRDTLTAATSNVDVVGRDDRACDRDGWPRDADVRLIRRCWPERRDGRRARLDAMRTPARQNCCEAQLGCTRQEALRARASGMSP